MARSVCADCAGSDQVSAQNAGANLGRSSHASENDPAFYCRLAKFRRWQLRIIEISQDECRDLLGRVSIGRLACSLEDQPYVIPTCFVYESEHVYVFSTLGQKIKWMRQNPKVCLQVDQFEDRSNWTSVVLNGTFVELRDSDEREHARQQQGAHPSTEGSAFSGGVGTDRGRARSRHGSSSTELSTASRKQRWRVSSA